MTKNLVLTCDEKFSFFDGYRTICKEIDTTTIRDGEYDFLCESHTSGYNFNNEHYYSSQKNCELKFIKTTIIYGEGWNKKTYVLATGVPHNVFRKIKDKFCHNSYLTIKNMLNVIDVFDIDMYKNKMSKLLGTNINFELKN